MERPMRRFRQQLSPSEARKVLERNTHGVLACVDEDGEPYAVPLSYACVERTRDAAGGTAIAARDEDDDTADHGTATATRDEDDATRGPAATDTADPAANLTLLFHCARDGHKLRCIEHEPRVSFCVVDADEVVPERFTTYFRSVIAFGRARVLGDEETHAMQSALMELARTYSPGIDAEREIANGLPRVAIVEFTVERLTGKQAKELV